MRETTIDLSNHFGLNVEEITSGTNGYPQNCRPVLTDFESIDQFKAVRDELEATGHVCTEILMHKKNGWDLWNYSNANIQTGMFRIARESEWTFDIDTTAKAKSKRNHIIVSLFGDRPENPEIAKEIAQEVLSELPEDEGSITVFYEPDQNYRVEYWASDQTTGYYEDTNHYKIGLIIESAPDHEEE